MQINTADVIGLTKYYDGNILVVWILLLVQTNVVVVFSATVLTLMGHKLLVS